MEKTNKYQIAIMGICNSCVNNPYCKDRCDRLNTLLDLFRNYVRLINESK